MLRPSTASHTSCASASESQVELQALLLQIADGRQAAFTRFYALTVAYVYGIAVQVSGDQQDAEEVTCDAYVQIWSTACNYAPDRASVRGWIAVIARSRALDCRRRKRCRTRHEGQLEPVDESESDYLSFERGSTVFALLAGLPGLQRKLLELSFFQDLSHREISECLGIPLGTVKSHLRRTIEVLRSKSLG